MEILKTCAICKKQIAKNTCIICGLFVCDNCYDKQKQICTNCKTGKKI